MTWIFTEGEGDAKEFQAILLNIFYFKQKVLSVYDLTVNFKSPLNVLEPVKLWWEFHVTFSITLSLLLILFMESPWLSDCQIENKCL